ncbi:hypothetical protein PT974_07090 [Cladobotryum mycophilum]|uniref:Uncharacterized protein n=1 Tax=Cladobotryum mycophilum TaxID=491253 RepID=A0ABR0SNB6_9HYPO
MADNPSDPILMQDSQDGSRTGIFAMARQLWADSARSEGNDNQLWVSTTSKWSSINLRFSQFPLPGHALEKDLHDLWFMYYHASKNISYDHPALTRLAFQLLQAQERGALSRRTLNDDTAEVAITSGGVIWTDLPFFVSDVTGFWLKDCAVMGAAQRLNFATFLAKLASVGLVRNGLCGIALIILRETLETPRQLGTIGDQGKEEEDPNRSLQDLRISELLPAANAWLFEAGVKIIQLSDQLWKNCSDDVGRVGTLCSAGTSDVTPSTGFSPSRWIFWLRRLEEVVQVAREAGDSNLAEYASRLMDNMLLTVDERDSSVKRELEASPGVVRYQPTVHELGMGIPLEM